MMCFRYNQHFVAMMNIINSARLNPPESGHKHHIIPKCWFRMNNLPVDNSKDNLVLLSYEDHIKVHKLAILCSDTKEMASKMGYAVHRLLKGQFKGIHHTEETKQKMSETHKGRTFSDESRRKMSEAAKNKVLSEEHRRKISEATRGKNNPMYGKQHTDAQRKKMSESLKGQNKGTHWYNDGKVNMRSYTCPEGFVKGKLNYGK